MIKIIIQHMKKRRVYNMNGRNILPLVYILLFASVACTNEASVEKPNILVIIADDQSFNTIGKWGNDEVITPTIDDLANRGMSFTNCYNMGGWNGAVCIASRTMFNTGRFLWRANEVDFKLDSLASREMLWSKEMERLGYDTYMTGKWHVKIKPEEIFMHVGTERAGMPNQTDAGYNRPLDENDWEWTPWDTAFGGFWHGGTHWSEVVANETIGFLDNSAESDKPFFMYIAFNAPHDPRQSPKEYVDMYPLENISLPESFLPEYPYKDEIGCSAKLRDEMLAPFPRTEYSVKVNRQEYYAIITHMDAQIRRILDHLEATGQDENTYIFFTADHGLSVGHHGLIGKQNMYEHSMKPPLIVVGPDIPEGEQCELPVYLQDVMPTALEYSGGEVPEYVDFHSLKKILEGKQTEASYPEIYGAYIDFQRMIRIGDYKLIVYPRAGVKKLFNLAKDPHEVNDLANLPEQKERVDELFNQLVELQKEMGDDLDLESIFTNL
jgi:arylsulfatase A-like enzyme